MCDIYIVKSEKHTSKWKSNNKSESIVVYYREQSNIKGIYPEIKNHLISKFCSKFQKVCHKIIIYDAILQVNTLLYTKNEKKYFRFSLIYIVP